MFQFIRTETYSRKADKGGRTVAWILDEVSRLPHACGHVKKPGKPIMVYGCSIEELRELHDVGTANARVTLPNGKTRALSVGQNTLLTIIASHPFLSEETVSDLPKMAIYEAWERDTVQWLKDLYGSEFMSAVRHTDESHMHIHAYVFPKDLKANHPHPGMNALRLEREAAIARGKSLTAAAELGDAAYKSAMAIWQNDYQVRVAAKHGLMRAEPGAGQTRLTRAEWHMQKKWDAPVDAAPSTARNWLQSRRRSLSS